LLVFVERAAALKTHVTIILQIPAGVQNFFGILSFFYEIVTKNGRAVVDSAT
jgi:hypothetical protein